MQSASELVREISTLELEVIQLERHLLSLYRAAFDQYLFGSPTSTHYACKSVTHSKSRSIDQETLLWKGYETNDAAKLDVLFDKECPTKPLEKIEEGRYNFGRGEQSHVCYLVASLMRITQCFLLVHLKWSVIGFCIAGYSKLHLYSS